MDTMPSAQKPVVSARHEGRQEGRPPPALASPRRRGAHVHNHRPGVSTQTYYRWRRAREHDGFECRRNYPNLPSSKNAFLERSQDSLDSSMDDDTTTPHHQAAFAPPVRSRPRSPLSHYQGSAVRKEFKWGVCGGGRPQSRRVRERWRSRSALSNLALHHWTESESLKRSLGGPSGPPGHAARSRSLASLVASLQRRRLPLTEPWRCVPKLVARMLDTRRRNCVGGAARKRSWRSRTLH